MNPDLQLQIYNPAQGRFVQCDGGNDSMQALQLQILLQMIELNTYFRALVQNQPVNDDGATIRSDALLDTSMFRQG